jgi:hypothetical protein
VSEHITATEAELAALTCLREGEELVVYDRYHRCHRLRRPAPRSAENPHRSTRQVARHAATSTVGSSLVSHIDDDGWVGRDTAGFAFARTA